MTEPICPVASIQGTTITMAQPCWNNSTERVTNHVGYGAVGTPTYIENAYELLNQPGEFYLDESLHTLYYVPRPGQDMTNADVEVARLESLVSGAGTASDQFTTSSSQSTVLLWTWMQPNSPEGFSEIQANYTVTGKEDSSQGLCMLAPKGTCPYGVWTKEPGNVQFSYDHDICLSKRSVRSLGAAGLNLDDGSQAATVTGCVFTDISGNATGDW